MSKIVCVLYPDPVDGYPSSYPRDELPKLGGYPGGQSLPTPQRIDFKPGVLLGSVSGELGLRKFLEEDGHELVVTADKDGPHSAFERELVDAEIVISQPFWPAYLTAERIAKAPNSSSQSPPESVPTMLILLPRPSTASRLLKSHSRTASAWLNMP